MAEPPYDHAPNEMPECRLEKKTGADSLKESPFDSNMVRAVAEDVAEAARAAVSDASGAATVPALESLPREEET